MPQKPKPIDWKAYLDGLIWKQDIEKVARELEEMTGRDLYEERTYSLCPQYLIDRPANFAMHGTVCNYDSLDPVQVMSNCLIDGTAYVKVGDWQHLTIEKYVIEADYDAITDELLWLLISYKAEDQLIYTEKYTAVPPQNIIYRPQRTYEKDRLEVERTIDLPFFPFVPFRWHEGTSFLDPVHEAVIRLEAAYRVIAVENIERRGLAMYLTGVRSVDDIKTAPRKLGRSVHMLPPGADFKSPGADGPGIDLMKWEIDQLWNGLEKATGVVSTEKLSTLSGVSRQIAEKPLLMLCEEIRNIYEKGMNAVAQNAGMIGAPKLEIHFKPLQLIENKTAHLSLMERALESGAIDGIEFNTELRRLLEMDSIETTTAATPRERTPEEWQTNQPK